MRKPRGKILTIDDLFLCCDVNPQTGCWEWKYGKHDFGYGRYRMGKKMETTHRLSYMLTRPDEDISELEVCHECDNPPCCNPDHLFSGTHHQNMIDMEEKGRAIKPGPKNAPKGEDHKLSVLTWEDVKEIRRLKRETDMTQSKMAEIFGVSFRQISRIILNKAWVE